ncbi:MAG: hypothetical protein IPH62_12380 [Ignavibacteriae bacterium]|nr:hypothetical protein [Ignavibacteriota bacterium]
MEFLKFEKKHVLGIQEIDVQHKEIYESVNHLYEILNGDKKEIIENYQSLLQKLKVHFETEENLMKKIKWLSLFLINLSTIEHWKNILNILKH